MDLLIYLYRWIIHYKIRYLLLFDYSYCGKICDKIVLIITFQESELLHIVLYLMKKILNFQIGHYLLSHLLIRIKITTTITYFSKKVCIKINPIQNFFLTNVTIL